MKTTVKDFDTFKKWFTYYQIELFGLPDYRGHFVHEPARGVYADIICDNNSHRFTVRLAKDWPDREVTEETLRRCALHECIHLLIGRLRWLGTCRFVTDTEMNEEDEALTVRLEHIFTRLETNEKVAKKRKKGRKTFPGETDGIKRKQMVRSGGRKNGNAAD